MRNFFDRFFNGKNSFRAASIILIVTLFLSNILGVIRDHYLTQKIPTDILSTYYAAFRIPDLLFNVLILGAISAAFIPVFSRLLAKKENEEAWHVVNAVINIAIISLIIACVFLAILMPFLVPLFVPGFDAQNKALTVNLARIMLGSPIFFGLSYILGGVLNSFKRFTIYSLSPLVYNLSIILGTIFLADRIGVYGVAIAVIAGAFLHMAIQIPAAVKLGFRFRPILDLRNVYVRRIGKLMFPRAIGLGANQILLLVFTSIASIIGGTAVAVYNLADNIQTMPMVVFGTSFAMAIFPTLSEEAAKKNDKNFSYYFTKSLRSILFFLVPISIGLILIRSQVVRLILGSGHFGWQQTFDTAAILGYFAAGLLFTSVIPLLARSFYALHNTKTPMLVTVITVAVSIAIGLLLTPRMKIAGLGLAYSLGSFVNAVILYVLLRKKIFIDEGSILLFLGKIILSTAIMAVAMEEALVFAALYVQMSRFWGVFVQAMSGIIVAMVVYFVLAWITNCEEIDSIKVVFAKLTGRSLVDQNAEPGR